MNSCISFLKNGENIKLLKNEESNITTDLLVFQNHNYIYLLIYWVMHKKLLIYSKEKNQVAGGYSSGRQILLWTIVNLSPSQ